MIIPWLIFTAVGLAIYTGFVKLSARVLRYRVSWKSSFFFAIIMLVLLIFVHVLDVSQPVAIRIGHGVLLLLGFIVLGGWFFNGRGTDRTGTVLGWGGGIRLIALAVGMMIVVGFAIVVPAQVFLSKHLSPPP
jgi:hypothetical protein